MAPRGEGKLKVHVDQRVYTVCDMAGSVGGTLAIETFLSISSAITSHSYNDLLCELIAWPPIYRVVDESTPQTTAIQQLRAHVHTMNDTALDQCLYIAS